MRGWALSDETPTAAGDAEKGRRLGTSEPKEQYLATVHRGREQGNREYKGRAGMVYCVYNWLSAVGRSWSEMLPSDCSVHRQVGWLGWLGSYIPAPITVK